LLLFSALLVAVTASCTHKLEARPSLDSFPQIARLAEDVTVSAVVLGEAGSASEPADVCTAGEGGQRYVYRNIGVQEWLRGENTGAPVRVRFLTDLLRQNCDTGLPSGNAGLETGRTYLLFLAKGEELSADGSDGPVFVLSDPYRSAWLMDGSQLVLSDPRTSDAAPVSYPAAGVLAALRGDRDAAQK
jgi:hypothetical protein